MSRVLVTGASGFIGRRLVPLLMAAGHSVVAVTRRPEVLAGIGARVVPLDLTERKTFTELPKEVDVIVHAAAERLDRNSDWEKLSEILRVNTLGTLNMLEYGVRCNVKQFVYCSTLSVYTLPQALPIREDGLTYPIQGLDSFYGISKLGGELLCGRYQEEGRLTCQCLRLGRVYGLDENPQGLLNLWIQKAHEGEEIVVYGDGERSLDFIYIDDVVRGIIDVVESNWGGGVLNIGSGVETSWRRLAEAIIDVFSPPGSPAPLRYVAEGNRMRCYLDTSKARSVLDFAPRYSLKGGLLASRDSKGAKSIGKLAKQKDRLLFKVL